MVGGPPPAAGPQPGGWPVAATARKEKAGGPADAIVEAQDMRHRSSGPIASRRKTGHAPASQAESTPHERDLRKDAGHERSRPGNRAAAPDAERAGGHGVRTSRRCLTPRPIWRQAVKGDKHGA